MRNKKLRLFLILCAVLVPLWFCFCFVASIEVPQQQRLLQCTSSISQTSITVPAGSHYDLLLGVPYPASSPVAFRGLVTISQHGHIVRTFPISRDNSRTCNWLHRLNLEGYILTWQHQRLAELDSSLESGQTYDISVQWAQKPPRGSSLWLSWLQTGLDRLKPNI